VLSVHRTIEVVCSQEADPDHPEAGLEHLLPLDKLLFWLGRASRDQVELAPFRALLPDVIFKAESQLDSLYRESSLLNS
jgi:hypothetical protein